MSSHMGVQHDFRTVEFRSRKPLLRPLSGTYLLVVIAYAIDEKGLGLMVTQQNSWDSGLLWLA